MFSKIKENCKENFWIDVYGSYYINPKHIVLLIAVKTDKMKNVLLSDRKVNLDLKKILVKNNFPKEARKFVLFNFESQETVDRDSRGDWHLHLQ
jgi:hypothetical protein